MEVRTMVSSRRFLAIVALVLAFANLEMAAAADWSPLSRQEALGKLTSPVAAERRTALGRLAEVGMPEDVPLMLQKLWDEDEAVRGMAEQAIWGLWLRANNSAIDGMFQTSLDLLQQHLIPDAIAKLDEVIAVKPDFAEAWNKRGDAYLLAGNEQRALDDYQHALELNPYHFGVLESCGEIWLERQDMPKAADYFRRALELNPNLWHVAEVLMEIEKRLANDRI
jgi:tetratricopeptide (TPR) repeat protein